MGDDNLEKKVSAPELFYIRAQAWEKKAEQASSSSDESVAKRMYETALSDYSKAIGEVSDNAKYRQGRATLLYNMGEYSKAKEEFQILTGMVPEDHYVWHMLGNSEFRLKNYESAIRNYEESVKRNDRDLESLSNEAICYRLLGDFPNAKTVYKRILDINPDYERAVLGLLEVSNELGDPDSVIEYCDGKLNDN